MTFATKIKGCDAFQFAGLPAELMKKGWRLEGWPCGLACPFWGTHKRQYKQSELELAITHMNDLDKRPLTKLVRLTGTFIGRISKTYANKGPLNISVAEIEQLRTSFARCCHGPIPNKYFPR